MCVELKDEENDGSGCLKPLPKKLTVSFIILCLSIDFVQAKSVNEVRVALNYADSVFAMSDLIRKNKLKETKNSLHVAEEEGYLHVPGNVGDLRK